MSPLPDLSVVKSLQLLGWAAACGDILQVQDPTSIHQHFIKVGGAAIFCSELLSCGMYARSG